MAAGMASPTPPPLDRRRMCVGAGSDALPRLSINDDVE
jgi:hypothetical protein